MKKYIHTSSKSIIFFLAAILIRTNIFYDTLRAQVTTVDTSNQDTVATVGPINITAEEFKNSYEYGPAFTKRKADSKKRYLNYMINEKLLALDGYSRGIEKTDDVVSILSDFENDIATEDMFVEDIANKIEISEAEIDTAVTQKQLELDIRWLYAKTINELNKISSSLALGVSFDSLYNLLSKDSISLDDKSMKVNRFQLGKKNAELATIIDTLHVGQVSEPIQTSDGWYIFILDNVSQNVILTESELVRLQHESINALKKKKMDQISEKYVNQLLLAQDPIIKRESFNVLRSFIGNYFLTKELYNNWELSEKLDAALNKLGLTKDNIGQSFLIVMNEGNVTLKEFLNWFWNRSQYVKFNKTDLPSFSKSLENLIWRMLRDKLLSKEAFNRNFHQTESFKEQSKWWRDKIVYSTVKNEIIESVLLEDKEVNLSDDNQNKKLSNSDETNQKILRKILKKLNELKAKYKVSINNDVLENIQVSEESNPKAIDMYIIKKGGLIPRPVYPSIDNDWAGWE